MLDRLYFIGGQPLTSPSTWVIVDACGCHPGSGTLFCRPCSFPPSRETLHLAGLQRSSCGCTEPDAFLLFPLLSQILKPPGQLRKYWINSLLRLLASLLLLPVFFSSLYLAQRRPVGCWSVLTLPPGHPDHSCGSRVCSPARCLLGRGKPLFWELFRAGKRSREVPPNEGNSHLTTSAVLALDPLLRGYKSADLCLLCKRFHYQAYYRELMCSQHTC